MGLLVLPLCVGAQQPAPACEPELAFYKRHAGVVASERDRYIQDVVQKDMQIAYLKQQLEQMKKAKAETQEKKD